MALRVWVGSFVTLSLLVLSTTALPAAENQSDEHIQRILKLIGDKDRDFRAAGLEQVRSSARGPELTALFCRRAFQTRLRGADRPAGRPGRSRRRGSSPCRARTALGES